MISAPCKIRGICPRRCLSFPLLLHLLLPISISVPHFSLPFSMPTSNFFLSSSLNYSFIALRWRASSFKVDYHIWHNLISNFLSKGLHLTSVNSSHIYASPASIFSPISSVKNVIYLNSLPHTTILCIFRPVSCQFLKE